MSAEHDQDKGKARTHTGMLPGRTSTSIRALAQHLINLRVALNFSASKAKRLPATGPEGGKVRVRVSPRIVIETRPRPALGRLLLPARLSGVSIHRRLALSGLGGCGVSIRRRYVTRRLDRGRLDVDHVTRPAEIVGPSARRRDSFTRAQPNGRPRTFAGSS